MKKKKLPYFNMFVLERGLSFLELVIAIAILGILIAATLQVVDPVAQIQKAKDTRRKSDLAIVQRAIQQYYNDFGQYPSVSSDCLLLLPAVYSIAGTSGNDTNDCVEWGNKWTKYLGTMPQDPSYLNSRAYAYIATNNGQTYYIYANLERGGKDPGSCNNGSECSSLSALRGLVVPTIIPNPCGASGVCNYGVSSPNVSP